MAMFRALSTSRSRRLGYDRLLDENIINYNHFDSASGDPDHAVLKRVTSVPTRMLFRSSSKKTNPQPVKPHQGKQVGKIVHPLFCLFDGRKKKKKNKMTANPDFSRYIEYLKEGGVWNKDTNSPVMYYK